MFQVSMYPIFIHDKVIKEDLNKICIWKVWGATYTSAYFDKVKDMVNK